jgi:hypothetical protein
MVRTQHSYTRSDIRVSGQIGAADPPAASRGNLLDCPPKQEVPVACNWGTGTFVDRSEFSGTAETVPVVRSGNNPCCTSCADRLARHHHAVTGDGCSGGSLAVPSAAQTQIPVAVRGRVP